MLPQIRCCLFYLKAEAEAMTDDPEPDVGG